MIIIKLVQILSVFMFVIFSLPIYMLVYCFNPIIYYRAVSFGFKVVLFLLGIKIQVLQRENIARAGESYIIVSNHQSYLDIPILSAVVPCTFIQRPVAFMPGFSWHFGKVSLIIKRDSPASIIQMIRFIRIVALKRNTPVVIFPESTRSVDGKIGELRIGAAAATKNLDLPILPITIINSIEILPRKKIIHNHGTVRVCIHPPIEVDYIKSHSSEEVSKEIKARLNQGMAL